jgi:formylmethanofuran dehydrogenase subunit C
MDIYVEVKRDRLRVKTGDQEIEIKIRTDFYTPIAGTESFEMFRDEKTNEKLKDFIHRHRLKLGLFGKINYWFFRNRVLILVDNEVQQLATIGQLYAYGTIHLDGRVV